MNAETIYRRRWWILVVLALSVFLVVVDNTIVNVALPTLSRDLNASTTDLQWIVDAYSLVFAGLLLAAGGLGDRIGRKGTMQAGLVIFAATSVVAAFSTSSGQLIASRAAMGIGAALVFPATLAILTNVFTDPTERAKAIGAWSAVSGMAVAFGPVTGGILLEHLVSGMAVAFGPVTGGILLEHFWWGSIFLVNVPIVAIALLAGWFLVPTSRDPDSGAFDWVGTVVSILGVGLLVYTVIEGPHAGWNSVATIGGFIGAAVLLAVFVVYELRREHPLLDVRVFRIARFSAAAGSIAIAFFTLFGFIFIVTQYFQFVRGYSTLSAGLHTLPFAIFAAITAPNAARLALRFGPRRVVGTGLLTMMIGFIIIGFCDADTAYFGPVVISMAFIATGLSLVTSPSTAAVMSSLPKEKAGAGAAVNDTTREIGGTLGVAVVGSVFASIYAPKIGEFLAKFPQVPADAVTAAKASMAAAIVVASRAPTEVQELFRSSASDAFMQGMRLGCFVCAGVALCGSIAAFTFLPDLESEEAPHPGEWPELEQS
ncbi:MAG: MFS transporter [Actinobacteria bacterium]|nr:MFS transporter [Actinomycetota bacterium]